MLPTKNTGRVKPGDRVVLTVGIATGISGQTNMIKIIKIP